MKSSHPPQSNQRNLPELMIWYLFFSNIISSLPPQKHIQELCSEITTDDHLTTTFKWSRIINQQLQNSTQQVQNYKDLIIDLEEVKHMYYQNVHHQGYADGKNSKKPQYQYMPIDVFNLFASYYSSYPLDQQSSISSDPDLFQIQALNFNLRYEDLVQKKKE